jgi:16S rRNA (cytidine1402-2'-O)-methyltransferase
LYVVATPIGNTEDLSTRAVRVLSEVDLIAAEDTRHSLPLLRQYGITTPLRAYHEFNERTAAPALLELLRRGRNIALISDAGTPVISDPGYRLVSMAHDESLSVVTVPGPSAPMAALSVSGLPADRFCFEGYLPEQAVQRTARLKELARESRTLIFFEAPHRITSALEDLVENFGAQRRATIARELTKRFETVRRASLGNLLGWLRDGSEQRKGEFVIVVEGAPPGQAMEEAEARRVLEVLLARLSVRDAAAAAAQLTGRNRKQLYALALKLRGGAAD